MFCCQLLVLSHSGSGEHWRQITGTRLNPQRPKTNQRLVSALLRKTCLISFFAIVCSPVLAVLRLNLISQMAGLISALVILSILLKIGHLFVQLPKVNACEMPRTIINIHHPSHCKKVQITRISALMAFLICSRGAPRCGNILTYSSRCVLLSQNAQI